MFGLSLLQLQLRSMVTRIGPFPAIYREPEFFGPRDFFRFSG